MSVCAPRCRAAARRTRCTWASTTAARAGARGAAATARLNLFAAYWVDNRTGVDLLFQDHAAARHLPLLLGARLPYAFAPVLVPGVRSCWVTFILHVRLCS